MTRIALCLVLPLLCLMPLQGLGADPSPEGKGPVSLPSEQAYEWQKSCNTNGLTIYWSKVEGSQVIAFKGQGIVDAPLEKVASIIIDTTRGTEWIDSLVESKVTRPISPSEFVEYDHVGISFPFDALMHDRDFVSHVTVQADPRTRRMTVHYAPTEDVSAPVLKKYVRGKMVCEFRLVPMSIPEETYVEAEIHCDPMGSVPKWIVNWFQEGWPQTTFENLRKQAKKADIQVLPVVADLLKKPSVKLAKGGR